MRLQNGSPINGNIIFNNQLSAELKIEPLGKYNIEQSQWGTYGMLSFSNSTPIWISNPNTVNYQKVDTISLYEIASKTTSAVGNINSLKDLIINRPNKSLNQFGKPSVSIPNSTTAVSQTKFVTYKVTSLAKSTAGKIFFLGVAIDAVGLANDEISEGRFLMNTIVGATALCISGWAGLAIGLIYFGLYCLGVLDFHVNNNFTPTYNNIQPVDNLRVVLPPAPIPRKKAPQDVIKRMYQPKQTFIGPAPKKIYK